MKHVLKKLLLLSFSVVVIAACKNTAQNADTTDSVAKDTTPQGPAETQHNFPESPVNITKDTSFTIKGQTYKVSLTQKTIDTSMVVFARKAMGKAIKDVYFDFEYIITPKSNAYKGAEVKITKRNLENQFNNEFLDYAILHELNFMDYSEVNKEYEFSGYITKPDTDNAFKVYFFINNKGELHNEVEDIES
jgi:hypothetical protein